MAPTTKSCVRGPAAPNYARVTDLLLGVVSDLNGAARGATQVAGAGVAAAAAASQANARLSKVDDGDRADLSGALAAMRYYSADGDMLDYQGAMDAFAGKTIALCVASATNKAALASVRSFVVDNGAVIVCEPGDVDYATLEARAGELSKLGGSVVLVAPEWREDNARESIVALVDAAFKGTINFEDPDAFALAVLTPNDDGTVVAGGDVSASYGPDTKPAAEIAKPAKVSGPQMPIGGALSFLEANPYYSRAAIPLRTYTARSPFIGKVVSVERIVGPTAAGETCNIVIDHQGRMPYWEGQCFGVLPPGIDARNRRTFTARLYSVASSRYGDDMSGTTATLCVRRATHWHEELNQSDLLSKGVCSNFLCDAKPGDNVHLTGPFDTSMLMPEDKPNADLIMVATGTGIAPFRAFWRRLFIEKTPAAAAFKGVAWLFLGVANTDGLLYDDELQEIKGQFPNNFKFDYALSREQTNKAGGRMYIQDKLAEHSDEVFDRLDNGAHIYFSGLRGMMPGIIAMFEEACAKKGLVWKDKLAEWNERGQWHVEVY
jgi:ferredoxin--NADP+ reductase